MGLIIGNRRNRIISSGGGGGSTTTTTSEFKLKYLVFTSDARWKEEYGGDITAGQVVTLKSGSNVAAANSGTIQYVPPLTFDGWSSPLAISNNTITIPSDIDHDVVVGAMYHTTDGNAVFVDKLGNVTSTKPSETENIVRVYYPSSVTSIEDYALNSCSALSSVVMPSSITTIGVGSFGSCITLSSIIIPSSVTTIGEQAFNGCNGLSSVVIPNSVTSIGGNAFMHCQALSSITIPESITYISTYTFNGCLALNYLKIPNSVKTIDEHAFDGCQALTLLKIPSSVTALGAYSFNSCLALSSISISRSIIRIEEYAFNGCNALTYVTIPSSVKSIGDNSFVGVGLVVVTIAATTPPKLGGTSAFMASNLKCIYVPSASVAAYKAATNWSAYASIIYAIPS